MSKFTEEAIKAFSNDHMFRLNDEEIERCQVASEVFLRQVKQLDLIDTEGVESMDLPYDTITTWLRDDVVDHTMNRQELLDNAPQTEDEFIEIVKVLV